jgi:hypothetical protein
MRKTLVFLILAVLLLPMAYSISDLTITPTNGASNSIPSDVFISVYGIWSNTKTNDGSCSGTECWGTGIEDVYNLTGNSFWQEFHFKPGNTINNISELSFCIYSCWSGGTNGCGHTDEPEFDSNNGTATIQIYNYSSGWENLGSINLGGDGDSSAMNLTGYCGNMTNVTNDYYQGNTLKLRVLVEGNYTYAWQDCEMFTDYAVLEINGTFTTPGGKGGGGGGGCKPYWVCSDWGECDVYGYKYRSCQDMNKCNIIDGAPETVTRCTARELCYNGLKDAGEEGIDCGGACEPCPAAEEPEPEEPTEIQQPIAIPAEVCMPFEWQFWILYAAVLILSYFTIFSFNKAAKALRKPYLLKIMIVANILLFIIAILDTVCAFRWYMIILLLVIFLTIAYLDKILMRK